MRLVGALLRRVGTIARILQSERGGDLWSCALEPRPRASRQNAQILR